MNDINDGGDSTRKDLYVDDTMGVGTIYGNHNAQILFSSVQESTRINFLAVSAQ